MCSVESRSPAVIAVSDFIEPLDQIARLLKFDREKERCRDTDALHFNALCVGPAGSNLIGPVIPTSLIGLAVQKIEIVLFYKETWHVDRIAAAGPIKFDSTLVAAPSINRNLVSCSGRGAERYRTRHDHAQLNIVVEY